MLRRMNDRQLVPLRDGRVLDAVTGGADRGELLIFHHGTPGGGLIPPAIEQALRERGMRGAAYARPGYGDSTRQPGRTVADCAADVAELADHLGADRFYTMGASGGGPHVLACAALLPDRLLGATAIAGVAPMDAEGLDWLAGTGELNLEGYDAWRAGPEAHRAYLERVAADMGDLSVERLQESLATVLSDVDRAVLVREFAEFVAATFRRAMLRGLDGWYDDDVAELGDWGFDPADIRIPLALWHGGRDRFVPFAHGEWLAAHVPGVRAHLLPEDGHLTIVLSRAGELVDELRELAPTRKSR
jgi:pimeloyl-ACP methyl ester carboxylesterase